MKLCVSPAGWICAAVFSVLSLVPSPAAAQDRLCDPAERDATGRDCRDILISHIRQETVGLDVAFWFMEDSWIAAEVIARHNARVPVRILMDTEANTSTPRNVTRLAEFQAAGIPMRERIASGILHWKMMLFEGQGLVEFSGANYSSDAWTVSGPDYTNYVDESIYFTTKPSIVDSFRTKFDDLWTNTVQYRDYANITGPLTRAYDTFPIDPELNFVPDQPHAARAIAEYDQETTKIDVIMYRITDSRYTDAMIAARSRGVPIRLITEPLQYRDPVRQYHSWNIDRMYMAGITIRNRAHQGLNHQKSVLLYNRGTTVFGSSNWSSASSESQEEHNLFSRDPWVFTWFVNQFERKWNNSTGQVETSVFAPLPPDRPDVPSPAYEATGVDGASVTLGWTGGFWAHYYDVYLGTSPNAMTLVAENVQRRSSGADNNSVSITQALLPGTSYYWRVVGKTMADMRAESPLWKFTTAGTPPVTPPPTPVTLVRQPYLQQVTPSSATVVWATRETGTAQVRLTNPGGVTTTVSATSTLFPATSTGMAGDYYQHVAVLGGLSAASTYSYDILVNATDLNAQLDTFKTAPASGSGTVSFVAFGDSGTGSTAQQQIAARLDSESFDFAVHGGDVAYGNTGGTGGATHQTMQDWFFEPYRNWLRRSPMFPSMGNHDSRASNADGRPYLDMFVLPTNGATATFPDHAERYYSFDYGPVHVVVLDTELAFQDNGARRAAQLAWLDADLSATTQPWKIAVFHRSPYSAGGEHGSDLDVRNTFGPVFDRLGVQLVISAHEHTYERTVPLRAAQPAPGGTVYMVTGGGGGPLYPTSTDYWTAFSASVHHYLKGLASECTLKVDAITAAGTPLDSVTLTRCETGPDTEAPSISISSPAAGATVSGDITVGISANDNVGVTAVTLIVDGVDIETDSASPFTLTWRSSTTTDGSHTLRVRAVDQAGNSATSNPVTVTVANPSVGAGDIVLYAADATTLVGNFIRQDDPSAAGGRVIRNPDTGAAKRTVALAAPADYFEMTFTAQPNTPYRLWMRAKADGDVYSNDSVFVQFAGASSYAIGTTSFTEYNLEDCSGCRISGWGWQDNGWGVGVLGPTITFTTAGPHRIRIQPREDGLSIDQIMLSPQRYLTTPPGALRNDTTIYPRSAGGGAPPPPPPADTQAPTASITAPTSGAVVAGNVVVSAAAADDVAVVRVDFLVDGVSRGSDTSAPYELTWDSRTVANGNHSLVVHAVDAAGNVGVSATIGVTVSNPTQPPVNVVPTVTLTGPAAGATFTAPATISLAATASDSDGSVVRVDFYSGSTPIGSDTTAPFTATWTNVAAGSYDLTARAVDNAGGMGTSSSVTVTVTPPAPSLPAPWASQDVGTLGVAGSATESGGVFTVQGEGIDIWNSADEFHYVWRRVSGDVDIVARVTSIENVHAWVKAGVMVRESLAANSAHGLMLVSPGKGYAFQRRVATGGVSTSTSGGTGTAPGWVKLTRRGNVVTAYRSGDGLTWTLVGTDTFTMPSDVYIGLVVSSHVDGRLATATFDNVNVVSTGGEPVEPDPPSNTPPTVTLTSPAAGATLVAPATINLAATAADSDGTVARVEFYAGQTLLATTTSSPHQAVWSDVPAGTYSLTARAFDNAGTSATSAAATVTVNAPAPAGLPAPWSSQDLGNVGIAGSASLSGTTFTVRASGGDVWGTADALHYLSQPLSGDFDVVARVTSVEWVHQWVKAGVMVRGALTADAAQGFMLVSPGKGLAFQRRVASGGHSTNTSAGAGTAPAWVKLERRGNTLTAYRSADGVTWTMVGSDTFSFGPTVYVGLGLTSHDNSQLATATFDNVRVTPR